MKKLIFVFTLATSSLFAQKVTKNPGEFIGVKVFDQISVKLIPSDESKVEISGNRAEEVEVINKNGELKIRMPFGKLLQGETIEATVYYQKLQTVEASEGSYINSETPIKSITFLVSAKEGAEIKIILDVQKANIKLNSGGKIRLRGTTENQDIAITSGGELNAKEFSSKQTKVSVSAGGEAEVYATDLVDAKVNAGGDIYIYGSPKQINQKTVLGGNIKEMK